MVRALAELLTYENEGDGNVLDDVAVAWAGRRMTCPLTPPQSRQYVQQLAALATMSKRPIVPVSMSGPSERLSLPN